jgi:predicted Ser/Thr protein kinase
MGASGRVHDTAAARADTMACVVLDAGPFSVHRREFAAAIRSILDGRIAELARDRNAVCYRVYLSTGDDAASTAIVKVPRPGPQRTNADATFLWEAKMLAALPAAGIGDAPVLLARIAAAGSHFLFMTEVPGKHPDPRSHPLAAGQLHAILDRLGVMDRLGFMHYDLKTANILLDEDRAGFVDFEFARFHDNCSAYAPPTAIFCADFNVSSNPFFPARSNVANFEFRALHRYLCELGATRSAADADALLRAWLRGKSSYHRRMAGFLAGLGEASVERFALGGGISKQQVRARLRAAARHEALLAALLEEPCDTASRVEWSLMAFRRAVFERRALDAAALRETMQDDIRHDAAHARALPVAYRKALARTLELVGRSTHPDN